MTAACGTDAGYQAHRRRREPRCPDCKAAHTRYTDSRRQATADPVAVDRAAAGHPPDPLTTAERTAAIRRLLTRGLTHTEIAARLQISRRTVGRHSRKTTTR